MNFLFYFTSMGNVKNVFVIGTAIVFGVQLTHAGYNIKRNFVKDQVRNYKVTYKVDSKSETSYETGFLTEKVVEANSEGPIKIKYSYVLNELVQKGKKIELKKERIKDWVELNQEHKVTKLYLGNTMLPYYLNVLYEGIPAEIPALNHAWAQWILDNNFQFEPQPVLPEARGFSLEYKLDDVIPFEDETHNYRITWQGIRGNWYYFSLGISKTPSRRFGSLLVGADSFPLQMTYQLPNKIPGFTLSDFILVDDTPIVLDIELVKESPEGPSMSSPSSSSSSSTQIHEEPPSDEQDEDGHSNPSIPVHEEPSSEKK